ncbi:MAG TPA: sigma-70 family RNA polymerase sigma factor [Actinomycetota bacterium]|jgi:RNA polymerase sigma-70 factor (ECF subfamily)|nr:sigma-70 family RNA polymerase sigma factor [Actinomycetota bacterium]
MDRFDREIGQAPDEDLLRRFVDGDEDAFSELMRRHEDRVFAVAYRITGDRSEALDATQEAFISLFKRAKSFRGDSAFSTWLYRIGMNAAYDVIRKRRPTVEARPDLTQELGSSGATAMEEAAGIRSDVAGALAALPAEYREAVVMHDLGSIPYEEIATLTKVSLGTVKSRISRGRRRLAELLEPSYRPETSKDQ